MLFYLLLLFLLSFVVRYIFSFTGSTDDDSHLWMINERRRNRDLRHHRVQNTPLIGINGYPPLAHFIISLFPKKYWSQLGKILNVVYDCITVITVFFGSYYIFKDQWKISPEPLHLAFVTGLIFSTTPILFPVTARLKSIGARTLGGLFYNLFLVCYAGGHIYSQSFYYALCVLFILLIFLSSQFATQVIMWSCLFLSVTTSSLLPIILLLISISILMLPLFDGKKMLKRKIFHFIWYIRYTKMNKDDDFGVQGRNRFKDVIMLPIHIFKHPKKVLSLVFRQNSFIIASYSLPIAYVFIYYYSFRFNEINAYDNWLFMYGFYVIFAMFIAFIVSSLRPFLFLGQAERYFEYAVLPMTLMAVFFIGTLSDTPYRDLSTILIVNLIIVCIMFVAINLEARISKATINDNDNYQELIAFLKKLESPKIITLPTKFAFKISLELKNNGSYYYDNVYDDKTGIDYMLNEHVRLYYIKPDFKYFHDTYGIDTFIFSLKDLQAAKKLGVQYVLSSLKEVFSNSSFWVGRYPDGLGFQSDSK
jgi:hypothetical protein